MRQLARVTVSMQELDRLKCIEAVVDGDLQTIRAAERLGLTPRQVRRLAVRYRREGPVGLISKRRNRPSNNRMDAGLGRLPPGYGFRGSCGRPRSSSPERAAPASVSSCKSMAASIDGSRIERLCARRSCTSTMRRAG